MLAVILLVAGAPALAHYSFPAEFDKSRPGELKGTIVGGTRIRMRVIG